MFNNLCRSRGLASSRVRHFGQGRAGSRHRRALLGYKRRVTQTKEFDGVPETIVDLCWSLTDFVERTVGLRPDYTPETLPLVDHYVREARATIEAKPALLDLTAQALGAYFGEVVRRSLTGFWNLPSPNYHDWQLLGRAAFFSINPIGVGYEVLTRGQHEGPSSELKMAKEDAPLVRARLESLPEEREESYYSLSTRYEVVELATECIRAQAESRGYSDMFYDLEDYAYSLSSGLPFPNG